jgi:hypothetical protein
VAGSQSYRVGPEEILVPQDIRSMAFRCLR